MEYGMHRTWTRIVFTFLAFWIPLRGETNALANSINHSGMFVFYVMEKPQNTLLSPFALSSSLLMAYMGADGNTAQEIARGLHLTMRQKEIPGAYSSLTDPFTDGDGKVEIGNVMWVDSQARILSSYKKIITRGFDGSIESVNFQEPKETLRKMNSWVFDKTDGKITQFFDPSSLSTSTRMILLNTLLVKGGWEKPFPTQNTGQESFILGGGATAPCKMMRQTGDFYYFENDDTQVISLPISSLNSHLAFLVFLPKKNIGNVYNFYYAQDESKPNGFLSYIQNLRKTRVNLSLPKFFLYQKHNLNPYVRAMGINAALTNHADFEKIDGTKNLMINKTYQQCAISIDEGGIFAASAGGVSFSLKSAPEETAANFHANHPFLYAIYDYKSELILFLGICQNPAAQQQELRGQVR